MDEVEEDFFCPNCRSLISRSDTYCKKCGEKIEEFLKETPKTEIPKATKPSQKPYERKFSLLQRFLYLFLSPSKAMEDVARAPSYDGISVIVVLNLIVLSFASAMILEKIQISGPLSDSMTAIFSTIIMFIPIIGVIANLIRWAIKSLIVKHACDSGSSWDFKTAASITGYTYLPSIIVDIPGLLLSWFLIPTFYIDVSNLEAATQAFNDYQAQITWLRLLFTLPLSLFALVWKSYLGSLGTHFGTKEKCSIRQGFLIFSGLSLIGLLISFVL